MAEEEGHQNHSLPKNEDVDDVSHPASSFSHIPLALSKRLLMTEEEGHHHNFLTKNEEEKKPQEKLHHNSLRKMKGYCKLCESPSFSRGSSALSLRPPITRLLVKPRAHQTNPNDQQEEGEEIDEEKAKCKFCESIFREENIVKIKCKCISDLALAHEECVGDKCNVCRLKIQQTRVRLDRVPVIARHKEENHRSSRSKSRFLCCLCFKW